MQKQEIRIKCLELAKDRARDPGEVVAMAKVFEEYILDASEDLISAEKMPAAKRGRPPKAGNADLLD